MKLSQFKCNFTLFFCFFHVVHLLYVKSLSQSPLVQAIFSRNSEEVTFLLNHEEDVNSLVILPHNNAPVMMFF